MTGILSTIADALLTIVNVISILVDALLLGEPLEK